MCTSGQGIGATREILLDFFSFRDGINGRTQRTIQWDERRVGGALNRCAFTPFKLGEFRASGTQDQ
ncbi:hypothetical protein SL1157_3280 [Ruegeria lacuscaerulensis ITI-1157]|nr:hypothetical protein SL1157_3280 [Ruegeria lacuscaerulensis ITI-1157]